MLELVQNYAEKSSAHVSLHSFRYLRIGQCQWTRYAKIATD